MEYEFSKMLARLQAAKAKSKLRIEDISEQSNVPIGTASKIFAGITTDPKIGTMMSIARALNISIDYLIYGKEPSSTDESFSTQEIDMIKKYRVLDERGKESVIATLEREYKNSTENEENPSENKVG